MAIKSPTTYGDHYWAMQVEAEKLFDETIEDALSPYFAGLLSDIPEITELPPGVQTMLRGMAEPHSAGLGGMVTLTAAEFSAEVLKDAMKPGMTAFGRFINRTAKETWLTSAQANLLYQRKKITPELWEDILASEGYESTLQSFLYKSQMPYPSIPDLVTYSRYHGDPTNVWSTLTEFYDIDPVDFKVWDWLGLQRLTTLQLQTLYKRKLINEGEFFYRLSEVGWNDPDSTSIEQLTWLVPNAMLMVQGGVMAERSDDELIEAVSLADINPKYAQTYLDAVLTKPSTSDIIAYELRSDPTLSDLPAKLRKIGIHAAYAPLLRELAHIIPPTGDLITMAVREAFTPAIAARFGQYEDFPPDFAYWAERKGLTKEWAERYWASHWTLPSAQQGFEMLHRGVIDQTELTMLLRALDIMPFWRDKLTKVAYKRLTRVDIRRMYRVGVLDEEGIYEANLELGYNERDSKRMTEFTVKQTLQTLSKFTSRDVIAAYTKRMIDRSDARSLLSMLDIKGRDIDFILSTADYKRAWAFTEDRIAGIRNLYKKLVYDNNKARAELLRLDMPSEQVDVLMKQWYYDIEAKVPRRWTTAQTLSFARAGLITSVRASKELIAIGWDTEHIGVFMESLK